jgi:hypothetical protein
MIKSILKNLIASKNFKLNNLRSILMRAWMIFAYKIYNTKSFIMFMGNK